MLIHAKTFTAIVSGQRLRDVTCEKCQSAFHYHLDRSATGSASSLYGMFPQRTTARAERNARKLLEKKLQRDVELVPCPNCHWINAASIRQFRKSKHQYWSSIAIAAAILAFALDLLFYFAALEFFNHPSTLLAPELLITTASAVFLIIICLAFQSLLRKTIDPNRTGPDGIPRVPVGTPPALIAAPDGTLTRAPGDLSTLPDEAAWAIFRAGQLVFEPLCCQCLDTATTTFKLPMTAQKRLPVPLCHTCLRSLRRQFWLRNLATVPAAFLLAFVIAFLTPGIDDIGRWVITGMLACVVCAITFTIIDATLTPYRFGILDSTRNVHKISFKNPAYTAILIRRIAQSDGLI